MFEATRLPADPRSAVPGELHVFLPVAAAYPPLSKPICKPDPAVSFRAAQGA